MTDTDPSAALDKIRKSHRQHVSENFPAPGICVSRCAERYPCSSARLLAAVDAVLAHHQPQPGMFPPTCFACAAWDEDAEETVEACWPCPTYLAISRALLGPEGPEGASG